MIIAALTLVGGLNWPPRPLRAHRGRYQARHEHASTRRCRTPPVAPSPGCSTVETAPPAVGSRRSWVDWIDPPARSERAAGDIKRATSTRAPGGFGRWLRLRRRHSTFALQLTYQSANGCSCPCICSVYL